MKDKVLLQEPKTARINIRLTEREKLELTKRADNEGMTVTEYILSKCNVS